MIIWRRKTILAESITRQSHTHRGHTNSNFRAALTCLVHGMPKDTRYVFSKITLVSCSAKIQNNVSRPSTPSLSLIGGGSLRFSRGMKLLDDLAPLAELSNYLIQMVDKEAYDKLVKARNVMIHARPEVRAICAVDPGLHSTMGLIVNRESGAHTDKRDALDSWAVMFSVGRFCDGDLHFPQYDIASRFSCGDAIVLRARDVEHGVQQWSGSLRVTIVYYSDDSVWKEFGISE